MCFVSVSGDGLHRPSVTLGKFDLGCVRFECSEPYLGLRGLWLDGNGIRSISGLSHLENLRALHLAQNLITDIGDGLVGLTNLMTLNLASNRLTKLEGALHYGYKHLLALSFRNRISLKLLASR